MITGQKDYVTPKMGLVIKYNGEFDLKNMYNSAKEFLIKNKYILNEKEYKEKSSSIGKEFNLVLDAERKIDDYVSFNINLHFLIIKAEKKEGKYNGNIQIRLSAYVLLDRKNKFQISSFKSFLFFFYNNFIIKNKIENVYEDKLFSEVSELSNMLKKYLKMN
jgi:hypothetical protein